jgi:two-component system chemotaxis response regulator CheY
MTNMETNRCTLVVDDSRVIRTIVGRALKELGFHAEEAGNGHEGLERLQQGLIPVVIMVDWNMPQLNGLEMVQAVRTNTKWNGVRLIMITSENELERVQTALEAGADEYIMKPFTKEMIQDKLNLLGIPIPGPTPAI